MTGTMETDSVADRPRSLAGWLRGHRRRGRVVAVLGADGSGKTSVIEAVRAEASVIFSGVSYFHLRPRVGLPAGDGAPEADPHGRLPRGRFVSHGKLVYYLLDFLVGFPLRVLPRTACGGLVLFDRYYHDLLADPLRYRYGGSLWAAERIGRLVPLPDLFILLDAPAEVLQERKREVTFVESVEVRAAYLALLQKLPNARVLDAARPLPEVVHDVLQLLTAEPPGRASLSP